MVKKHNEHFVYKRYYDEKSTNLFKQKLHETTWGKHTRNFSKFSVAYTCFFPKKEITVKLINLMNPWVTKGIAKSLKKKQRLYEKYLKKRGAENEKIYKKH